MSCSSRPSKCDVLKPIASVVGSKIRESERGWWHSDSVSISSSNMSSSSAISFGMPWGSGDTEWHRLVMSMKAAHDSSSGNRSLLIDTALWRLSFVWEKKSWNKCAKDDPRKGLTLYIELSNAFCDGKDSNASNGVLGRGVRETVNMVQRGKQCNLLSVAAHIMEMNGTGPFLLDALGSP